MSRFPKTMEAATALGYVRGRTTLNCRIHKKLAIGVIFENRLSLVTP